MTDCCHVNWEAFQSLIYSPSVAVEATPSACICAFCLHSQVGAPGNWDHIVNQIGMFSFTGLNKVGKCLQPSPQLSGAGCLCLS